MVQTEACRPCGAHTFSGKIAIFGIANQSVAKKSAKKYKKIWHQNGALYGQQISSHIYVWIYMCICICICVFYSTILSGLRTWRTVCWYPRIWERFVYSDSFSCSYHLANMILLDFWCFPFHFQQKISFLLSLLL